MRSVHEWAWFIGLAVLGAAAEWLLPVWPGMGFALGLTAGLCRYFVYRFVALFYVPVCLIFLYLALYLPATILAEDQATPQLGMQQAPFSNLSFLFVVGGFSAAFFLFYITLFLVNVAEYPGCITALAAGGCGAAGGLLILLVGPQVAPKGWIPGIGPFWALAWQLPVGAYLLFLFRRIGTTRPTTG